MSDLQLVLAASVVIIVIREVFHWLQIKSLLHSVAEARTEGIRDFIRNRSVSIQSRSAPPDRNGSRTDEREAEIERSRLEKLRLGSN